MLARISTHGIVYVAVARTLVWNGRTILQDGSPPFALRVCGASTTIWQLSVYWLPVLVPPDRRRPPRARNVKFVSTPRHTCTCRVVSVVALTVPSVTEGFLSTLPATTYPPPFGRRESVGAVKE